MHVYTYWYIGNIKPDIILLQEFQDSLLFNADSFARLANKSFYIIKICFVVQFFLFDVYNVIFLNLSFSDKYESYSAKIQ